MKQTKKREEVFLKKKKKKEGVDSSVNPLMPTMKSGINYRFLPFCWQWSLMDSNGLVKETNVSKRADHHQRKIFFLNFIYVFLFHRFFWDISLFFKYHKSIKLKELVLQHRILIKSIDKAKKYFHLHLKITKLSAILIEVNKKIQP